MGYYGETFLTKQRWRTKDKEKAEKSIFMWYESNDGEYTLSWLGVINGFLSKVGLVLVCETEVRSNKIKNWYITRKWW